MPTKSERLREAQAQNGRDSFRRIMVKAGWTTQRAFSEKLGVHETVVSASLRGKRRTTDDENNRIARLLKVHKSVVEEIFRSTYQAT